MNLFTLFVVLALLHISAGHTVFTTLILNGVDQGDGTCIRMPTTPGTATFPINNLMSDDMACGKSITSPTQQPQQQPTTLSSNLLTFPRL